MKPRVSPIFVMVMTGVALATGAGFAAQWRQSVALRAELDGLRFETDGWTRLRTENQRLRAAQISTVELEALRADHAALPRLRAELEALKKGGR